MKRFGIEIVVVGLTMAAMLWASAMAAAGEVVEINWQDLVPAQAGSTNADIQGMFGIVEHEQISKLKDSGPGDADVVTDYNGKTIRLAGYLVPLDLTSEGGTEFLLVPYYGACIHVPPPPPNQIVFVTTEKPYQLEALFDPVAVTGAFGVLTMATALADTGYVLAAEKFEDYDIN